MLPNCWLIAFLIILLTSIIPTIMAEQQSSSEQHGPMVGGLTKQDPNSNDIQALASKSVAKISAESNGIYQLVPVKVLDAHSQVVAGILYHLKILVGQSGCTKNEASANLSACNNEGNNTNARKVYSVKIWQKPWENFEQITYSEGAGTDDDE